MTTFLLKDYYDNLLAGKDNENKEVKSEDDEFSGGIPIPFLGWAQIDQEDTEAMLRKQLEIVNGELLRAQETVMEQVKMLDLFTRFIKEEDLTKQWMFYVQDRKSI
jgi:hemolysin-activating ACP:hemolysin acyltransferase